MNVNTRTAPPIVDRLQSTLDAAGARADKLEVVARRIGSGDAGAVRALPGQLRALSDVLAQSSDLASVAGARRGAAALSQLASEARDGAVTAQLEPGTHYMPLDQQNAVASGVHFLSQSVSNVTGMSAADLIARSRAADAAETAPPSSSAPEPAEGGSPWPNGAAPQLDGGSPWPGGAAPQPDGGTPAP